MVSSKGNIMAKRFMATMVAVVLAVGLMPAPALAADVQGTVVGTARGLAVQSAGGLATQAASKATKKMRSCYKKVLKQALNGKGKFKSAYSFAKSTRASWYASYSMYDVNRDGTPELFVHAGSYNANTVWYAFTVKSGKAKFLGTFGTGQMTLGAGTGHKLYGTHVHMSAYAVALVKLSKGKIKTTWKYEGHATVEGLKGAEAFVKKKGIKSLPYLTATNLSTLNSAKVTK